MPPARRSGSSPGGAGSPGQASPTSNSSMEKIGNVFMRAIGRKSTSSLDDRDILTQGADVQTNMFVDAAAMKQQLKAQMLKPAYDVAIFYHKTGCAQAIARNFIFECCTLSVISLNALWISIDTDLNGADTLIDAHIVFQVAENFFCTYFFMEWLIRFLAFKRKLNGLRDAWFVFDSLLVATMVLETWVMSIIILASGQSGSGGLGNASILRMARLLRLTRMARMARLLRAMPELMILVKGMVAAMRSVIFTLFLLVVIIYIFAILFKQLSIDTALGEKYFGSVPLAMTTLLHRAVFMDEFNPLAEEVSEKAPLLLALLYVFILIGSLTLMNMLIGVLVDVVQAVASTEKEALTMGYVKDKIKFIMLHSGMDADQNGAISRKEFLSLLQNPVASRTFLEVDVDPVNLVDAVDWIFASDEIDENDNPMDKELQFADLMEIVLALRGTNTATVRDIVDLRKFIQKEVKGLKDQSNKAYRGSLGRQSSWPGGSENSDSVGQKQVDSLDMVPSTPLRNSNGAFASPTLPMTTKAGPSRALEANILKSKLKQHSTTVATKELIRSSALLTSLRKVVNELEEQHERAVTELQSENKRLLDELARTTSVTMQAITTNVNVNVNLTNEEPSPQLKPHYPVRSCDVATNRTGARGDPPLSSTFCTRGEANWQRLVVELSHRVPAEGNLLMANKSKNLLPAEATRGGRDAG